MTTVKKVASKGKTTPAPKAGKASSPSGFLTEMVDALVAKAGEGSAFVLSGSDAVVDIRGVISTQCEELDEAIGRGGVPLGRMTILVGPPGCGKTTVCLHLAAEVQAMGGVAFYIDKEYKFDPRYAEKIGVDKARFVLSQPTPGTLEQICEMLETIIAKVRARREETGERVPTLVVLDSMNACPTKVQLEKGYDETTVGAQSRVLGPALNKLIPLLHKEDIAWVVISQERHKIGVTYGDTTSIAGGNAFSHHTPLIIDFKKIGAAKDGEDKVGQRTKATCKKNQIAIPFQECEFDISYGVGIDRFKSLLRAAEELGITDKAGSWISYKGERIGQGFSGAREALQKDPLLAEAIKLDVREARKAAAESK